MRYLVGVGNYNMSDDGVGIRVVEHLSESGLERGFTALDLSHDILDFVCYFTPETERILVVDCVRMGMKPGRYRFFGLSEVETIKKNAGFSTHEGDLFKVISLASSLGDPVPPIRFMGIEPESTGQGMELSPRLCSRLDEYARAAVEEIRL